MAKEYKPGQFVSIWGKLHRVKEAESTCTQCLYNKSPYIGEKIACEDCIGKLRLHQYPEPIPKRQG